MHGAADGIRRALRLLKDTPLHPQWLVLKDEQDLRRFAAAQLSGTVLDIGCAGGPLRALLAPGCRYIGIDYPGTVIGRYDTRPDVFGDAHRLPFGPATMDGVALLDVLEHLSDPALALAEIARVLKPGGRLVVQIPFLYPLHDEPADYQRLTRHGLSRLLTAQGFTVEVLESQGRPMETAAALWNLALARTALDQLRPSPRVLLFAALLPLLAVAVPLVNLAGWLLGRLSNDAFMPLGYRVVCTCSARSS